jgi:predicted RNase H-like HicB family nuclease
MPTLPDYKMHYFDQGPVVTAQVALGYYVAFEPDRPNVRGRGDTVLSSIANLNKAIEAAGEEIEERA